jgi:PPOX class probable F420-dependent enzyme
VTSLADDKYVSFTTFRKSGVGVPTPVWVAADGGQLVFVTVDGTGKVKRLARDPRVELRPCDMRGNVAQDAPVSTGTATVSREPADLARVRKALGAKYGLAASAFTYVERLAGLVKIRTAPRAAVLITLDPAAS